MSNKIHLLITADQEPNIGVIETIQLQIHNVSPVNEADVVNKLKTALADHFDCNVDEVKIALPFNVKSTTALDMEVHCTIPDVSDCPDEIVVSLTKTYIY
jgi:hypothetical protein